MERRSRWQKRAEQLEQPEKIKQIKERRGSIQEKPQEVLYPTLPCFVVFNALMNLVLVKVCCARVNTIDVFRSGF